MVRGGDSPDLLFFAQQETLGLSPEPKSFRTKTLLIDRDH
jgi:hypothetical protein